MFSILSQSQPSQQASTSQEVIVFSFLGVMLAYYLVLLFLHYSRGGLFPVSERSFKLSFLSGICSMLYVTNLILSCWLNYQNNIVTAPNLKQYCGFDRYSISCNQFSTDRQNLLKGMQFFNNFLKILEILAYLARTIRISYVVKYNVSRVPPLQEEAHKHQEGFTPDPTTVVHNDQKQLNQQEPQENRSQQQDLDNNRQCVGFPIENDRTNNNQGQLRLASLHQLVGVNVNQGTVQGSEASENNHTLFYNGSNDIILGEQRTTPPTAEQEQQQKYLQQQRRLMEESLMYSVLSFSNEPQTVIIPQTKSYYIFKHEYILILISFVTAALLSVVFIFEPSSSPFLFWNVEFPEDSEYVYPKSADNYIYISTNFIIIMSLLFCLHLIGGTEDNYKLKTEIFLILGVFFVSNASLQFQCPTLEETLDPTMHDQYIFGVFPLRILISALLDFVAMNVVLLRPILLATAERPWYSDQIVQDNIGFFCTKFRNFEDFLVSFEEKYTNSVLSGSQGTERSKRRKSKTQHDHQSKNSNSASGSNNNNNNNNHLRGSSRVQNNLVQCNLLAILDLYLEMKSKEQPGIWMNNVANTFSEFPDLVSIFRMENIQLEEIFEIDEQNDKVIGIRESIQPSAPMFLLIYRHAQNVILRYKRMFKMTQQYALLQRRYYIQNFISLTLQEFGMTGDNND